ETSSTSLYRSSVAKGISILSIPRHARDPGFNNRRRAMEQGNSTSDRKVLVSVVVPAFNEEANLPCFYKSVQSVLEKDHWTFELIVIDDGSRDQTLAVLKELRLHDPRVHYVSLSRNFGHQAALLAGLDCARGNVVISMDADLQHPPAMIPRMLDLWLEGYD